MQLCIDNYILTQYYESFFLLLLYILFWLLSLFHFKMWYSMFLDPSIPEWYDSLQLEVVTHRGDDLVAMW